MNPVKFLIIACLSLTLCLVTPAFANNWFLKSINTPTVLTLSSNNKKVVIAIVDDGVRITHQDLKDFIWVNPNEVPENSIDDDGNGWVDDVNGWDVADNNNVVYPPQARMSQYYHGTHVAGIITQIVKASLGESASEYIALLSVKTLSDAAPDSYLRDAYKGVEYAIDAGADIILTAWGVGPLSAEESRILEKAKTKGILIIASAGNVPEEKKQYPAAFPAVVAVAGLNQNNKKLKQSNFGQFVDLSAPAIDIYSSSVVSDSAYEYKTGTSFATAMTAAAAALVMLKHPDLSAEQITVCLKTSTDALTEIDPIYHGKLGAGKLNINAAISCPFYTENDPVPGKLIKPQGYLHLSSSNNRQMSWIIEPQGDFKGLRFHIPEIKGEVGNSVLKFYSKKGDDTKLISSFPLTNLPESFYIAKQPVIVSLEADNEDLKFDGVLQYEAETIDFTKLYCKDTIYLNNEGVIEDGSGDKNYSIHSDCKWLITAPEGKVINIKFTELDTESRVDLIYFFDGAGTHEKIMAIFSGSKIPPELMTWRNQVLIWFVSNEKKQAKGWKAHYTFADR